MKITYQLLADCPHAIPELAAIWYEGIGKPWVPNASIDRAIQNYQTHCNRNALPLTMVAFADDKPIGMASLRENDGIQAGGVAPWLGSVVVNPNYRSLGVGEALIEKIKQEAVRLSFSSLYLFALDQRIPDWYEKLGWKIIGTDVYDVHPVTVMSIAI